MILERLRGLKMSNLESHSARFGKYPAFVDKTKLLRPEKPYGYQLDLAAFFTTNPTRTLYLALSPKTHCDTFCGAKILKLESKKKEKNAISLTRPRLFSFFSFWYSFFNLPAET